MSRKSSKPEPVLLFQHPASRQAIMGQSPQRAFAKTPSPTTPNVEFFQTSIAQPGSFTPASTTMGFKVGDSTGS